MTAVPQPPPLPPTAAADQASTAAASSSPPSAAPTAPGQVNTANQASLAAVTKQGKRKPQVPPHQRALGDRWARNRDTSPTSFPRQPREGRVVNGQRQATNECASPDNSMMHLRATYKKLSGPWIRLAPSPRTSAI